jgi:hypothetical protein
MHAEQWWVDINRATPEYLEKNLPHRHFLEYGRHMGWPGLGLELYLRSD